MFAADDPRTSGAGWVRILRQFREMDLSIPPIHIDVGVPTGIEGQSGFIPGQHLPFDQIGLPFFRMIDDGLEEPGADPFVPPGFRDDEVLEVDHPALPGGIGRIEDRSADQFALVIGHDRLKPVVPEIPEVVIWRGLDRLGFAFIYSQFDDQREDIRHIVVRGGADDRGSLDHAGKIPHGAMMVGHLVCR